MLLSLERFFVTFGGVENALRRRKNKKSALHCKVENAPAIFGKCEK